MSPLQFLLADDHPFIRAGLRHALGTKFDAEITEAASAAEALEIARRKKLDLILLDITMPGRSGLDIMRDLKAVQPDAAILILSMHSEKQFAARALRAGARGYITKSSAPGELVKAVTKVLNKDYYVSEALAAQFAATFAEEAGGAAAAPAHQTLSGREFEVLRLIAHGNRGKEIAAALSLSFKTVSTYRTRILQKLGLQSNADLVRYALREGLIEGADGPA